MIDWPIIGGENMRGPANGEVRGANSALETISAAATAIASAENPVPQTSVQKRKWMGCWSGYWCFGSQMQNKRIGHAAFVPETPSSAADRPAPDNPNQVPYIVFPFVAPPSSPASFLPSEPPSATQSPSCLISFSSMSASMYSPGRPASIFTIGPYAHETQLVSPPVFSTYTTEPSTAPFTPPPESVHLTTPSSPEVPFAKFLDPKLQNVDSGNRFPLYPCDFQSYQLQPGSPVSHLISPGSAISGSGTSSPFPHHQFTSGHPHFIEFRTGGPPELLRLEKIGPLEWGSQPGSGTLTPDAVCPCDNSVMNRQNSDVAPLPNLCNGLKLDELTLNHRVSFEITAEDVLRCVEKKPGLFSNTGSAFSEKRKRTAKGQECSSEVSNGHASRPGESCEEISGRASADNEEGERPQKNWSSTLGSAKEFNFDSVNREHSEEHSVGSKWWANEKVIGQDSGNCHEWSFFPMMHPGVG